MLVRCLCCILALGFLLPTAASAEEISIAVMEFASKGGTTAEQMDALSDMLANEIRAMGSYKVVGKSDIRAALQLEEQKQLLGCGDESCLAEIGGALGVRWVLVGNISKFGSTYLLNLKMIDVQAIKVVAGISRKVTGGEDMLIDALGLAAKEIISKTRTRMAEVAGQSVPETKTDPKQDPKPGPNEDPPVEDKPGDEPVAAATGDPVVGDPGGTGSASEVTTTAPASGSSLSKWGHATFWSGSALLVLGVASGGLAASTGGTYSDEDARPEERAAALDESRGWAAGMWVGLFSGAALMTTGVILWVVAPDEAEEATEAPAAGIAPSADGSGAVLTVGGRW